MTETQATRLILFDCDGTLVDSEWLYNSITAELLNGLGFSEYTPELCIELFAGQAWSSIKKTLEAKHGMQIPRDIVERYIAISNQKMDTNLNTPEGIIALLEDVQGHYSICVASNGERNNVIKSLTVCGLKPFFPDEHIFTKIQVERPKPAPDLFLYAAEQMGYAPEYCTVIEDSIAGVLAGVAAGMHVIGFTGCVHDKAQQRAKLEDAGADAIYARMDEVSAALLGSFKP